MAIISTFLSNKRVPVTWVMAKDRQSCYWELESPKLHAKSHFTIKNGLKNLFLAILGAKCNIMAAISTFLSNKCVPVTWVRAKDRQSCYWELESPKLHGIWLFTIKMVLKNLILAILDTKCKKMAAFPHFCQISAFQ
jgi:hypothetical protein